MSRLVCLITPRSLIAGCVSDEERAANIAASDDAACQSGWEDRMAGTFILVKNGPITRGLPRRKVWATGGRTVPP
jgi:hypothetical protein